MAHVRIAALCVADVSLLDVLCRRFERTAMDSDRPTSVRFQERHGCQLLWSSIWDRDATSRLRRKTILGCLCDLRVGL